MLNSLTHRVISSEKIGKSNREESLLWAKLCINQNLVSDSILILSSLEPNADPWEVRDHLSLSLKSLGLDFLPEEKSLHCYIQSYIIEILATSDIMRPLERIYEIYEEFDHPYIIRNFWLLYWAYISWRGDHENKLYYWEGFTIENSSEIIKGQANRWLNEHGKEYFNLEQLKVLS